MKKFLLSLATAAVASTFAMAQDPEPIDCYVYDGDEYYGSFASVVQKDANDVYTIANFFGTESPISFKISPDSEEYEGLTYFPLIDFNPAPVVDAQGWSYFVNAEGAKPAGSIFNEDEVAVKASTICLWGDGASYAYEDEEDGSWWLVFNCSAYLKPEGAEKSTWYDYVYIMIPMDELGDTPVAPGIQAIEVDYVEWDAADNEILTPFEPFESKVSYDYGIVTVTNFMNSGSPIEISLSEPYEYDGYWYNDVTKISPADYQEADGYEYYYLYDKDGNYMNGTVVTDDGQEAPFNEMYAAYQYVWFDPDTNISHLYIYLYSYTDYDPAYLVTVNWEGQSSAVKGVEAVEADGPVEYYNLQGVRVANPENGLFIRRQGNKTQKVMIR